MIKRRLMLRHTPLVALAVGALLATSALPASAAPRVHRFTAPYLRGAYGYGTYVRSAHLVKLRLCVKDTRRDHLGAIASAAFTDKSENHYQNALTYNFSGAGHTVCKDFTSRLTGHLQVMVARGTRTTPRAFSDPRYLY
jgi:hypothetical protein